MMPVRIMAYIFTAMQTVMLAIELSGRHRLGWIIFNIISLAICVALIIETIVYDLRK